MQISHGKRILPSIIFISLFVPSFSWGDCFDSKITALANSSKPIKARVISNKKLSINRCQLTLLVSGKKIIGEAQFKLCTAKKNDTVKIKIKIRCCDTQPCEKGKKNKIIFSPWIPSLKAMLPSIGSTQKNIAQELSPPAAKTSRPQATIKAELTATEKYSKPITKNDSIKNTTNIASAENLAAGKGSASTTTKVVTENDAALLKNDTSQRSTLASTSAAEDINALLEANPPAAGPVENGRHSLDKYKVELGVEEEIYRPGPPGQLTVWIGDPALSAEFTEDMATAETTIAAVAPFAKVTPNAPDFEVEPKESICLKIDPSGSEVFFAITPKHTGTFKVGASVLLYDSDMCDGAPVPKSAADLEVDVKVNPKGVAKNFFLEMGDILWKGALNFWTWLVATIFGLFVFLIRKKLKKWFGFDAPNAGPSDN